MNGQVQCLTPVIPTTQEVEIVKLAVQGQPEQKVCKTAFQPINSWVVCWHKPVISTIGDHYPDWPWQKHEILLNNT
jgi:hypothetical protein